MRSPQVLASFAKNYKTGEPIPAELVARMNRASAFGRASWVSQQDTYTAISYDIYKTKPEDVDLDAVATANQKKYTLLTPLPGTHMYTSFGHLGGYSSAYYTYLWDKVIAEDFFSQFDQNNLLAGPAPMRYRRTVLQPGGSVSANTLVKNFLGREQNMDAFQKWMGEEFAGYKLGQDGCAKTMSQGAVLQTVSAASSHFAAAVDPAQSAGGDWRGVCCHSSRSARCLRRGLLRKTRRTLIWQRGFRRRHSRKSVGRTNWGATFSRASSMAREFPCWWEAAWWRCRWGWG